MMETRTNFQPSPSFNMMGSRPYFQPSPGPIPPGPTPPGLHMMGNKPCFQPPLNLGMMETGPSFHPFPGLNNPYRRSFSASGMAGDGNIQPTKKVKVEPPPIPPTPVDFRFFPPPPPPPNMVTPLPPPPPLVVPIHKQFWKAGDYGGEPSSITNSWESYGGGTDHIRVHPRFLHSNATSHKWVLGAFAELLDNALDESRNRATFVSVDMIKNKKNGGKMLVIEDNGGGMDPIKMRQCMSLGYSAKSKIANTIGQYGNGFKTSTMRLGADVVVLSRSRGENGKKPTQSIGLLSYTFLRCTHKEDIEVPMLDYERRGEVWEKVVKENSSDWSSKVNTIVQWSPFSSEADIFEQFNWIQDQGTRIYIYNLWEDDQNELELDFDTDPHDIQIRGANRDEKNIEMAKEHPSSRHFLTYKHSLRSYAAILYLRLPRGFRMILRGKEIKHHNIVNDMMLSEKITYRPTQCQENTSITKDSNMVANVTVGFVKDAKAHIDVQGFNVYHMNRLIKPFWRVWSPVGSDGRGVIGVLEANFVKPAHDKQGFEETIVLTRLKAKLAQMQKHYWSSRCHEIGYAQRRGKKVNDPIVETDPPTSPDFEGSSGGEVSEGSPKGDVSMPLKGNTEGVDVGRSKKSKKKANQQPRGFQRVFPPQDAQTVIPLDDARHMVEGKEDGEISESEANGIEPDQGFFSTSAEEMTEDDHISSEMLKMKDQLRDLLKDLEQERNKNKSLESDLDQERSKCKLLEFDLDLERGKSKSLVSELDEEMDIYKDKCISLQSELDQERSKFKSLESELKELSVYKEGCESLVFELDLERKKCKSLESENKELISGRDYLVDIFSDGLKNSKRHLQETSTRTPVSRTVIKHFFHSSTEM